MIYTAASRVMATTTPSQSLHLFNVPRRPLWRQRASILCQLQHGVIQDGGVNVALQRLLLCVLQEIVPLRQWVQGSTGLKLLCTLPLLSFRFGLCCRLCRISSLLL